MLLFFAMFYFFLILKKIKIKPLYYSLVMSHSWIKLTTQTNSGPVSDSMHGLLDVRMVILKPQSFT